MSKTVSTLIKNSGVRVLGAYVCCKREQYHKCSFTTRHEQVLRGIDQDSCFLWLLSTLYFLRQNLDKTKT